MEGWGIGAEGGLASGVVVCGVWCMVCGVWCVPQSAWTTRKTTWPAGTAVGCSAAAATAAVARRKRHGPLCSDGGMAREMDRGRWGRGRWTGENSEGDEQEWRGKRDCRAASCHVLEHEVIIVHCSPSPASKTGHRQACNSDHMPLTSSVGSATSTKAGSSIGGIQTSGLGEARSVGRSGRTGRTSCPIANRGGSGAPPSM